MYQMNHIHGQASGINAIVGAFATSQAKSPQYLKYEIKQIIRVHESAKPSTPLQSRKSAAQVQPKQTTFLAHVQSHPMFSSPLRPKQNPLIQQTHTPVVLNKEIKSKQPHHQRQSQISVGQLQHIILKLQANKQKNREFRQESIGIINDARAYARQSIYDIQKQYSNEIAKLLEKNNASVNENLDLKNEIINLHNTIKVMEQNINELQQQIDNQQQQQELQDSGFNRQNNEDDEIDALKEEIAEYEANQEDLMHQIKELNSKLQNEKSLRFEIQSKKEELDKYYTMAYEQVQANAEQERVYLQHISDLQNEIQQHDQGMTMIQQDNEILRSENARLLELIQELQNQQNSYKSLDEDRMNIQFEQKPQNYMLVQDEQLEACPKPELQEPQQIPELQQSDLENQITVLQQQVTYYEAELQEKNKIIKQMQEMLSSLEKDKIPKLTNELEESKIQAKQLNDRLASEIEVLKSKNQQLLIQIEADVTRQANYNYTLVQAKEQIQQLTDQLIQQQKQYTQKSEQHQQDKSHFSSQLEALQNQIVSSNDKYQEPQQDDNLKIKISHLETENNKLTREVEQLKIDKQTTNDIIDGLNQELEMLKDSKQFDTQTDKQSKEDQYYLNQIQKLQQTIEDEKMHCQKQRNDDKLKISELEKQLSNEIQKQKNLEDDCAQLQEQINLYNDKLNSVYLSNQKLNSDLEMQNHLLLKSNHQITSQQKIIDELEDQKVKQEQNSKLKLQELQEQLTDEIQKHQKNQLQVSQLQNQLNEQIDKQNNMNETTQSLNLEITKKNTLLEEQDRQMSTLQENINNLNKQIARFQEQEKSLQDEVQKHKNQEINQTQLQQQLQQDSDDLKRQIQQLNQELANKNAILEQQTKQISDLQNNIDQLKTERTQSEESLKHKIQVLEKQLSDEIQKQISHEVNQAQQQTKSESPRQSEKDQQIQRLNAELLDKNNVLDQQTQQISVLQNNIVELTNSNSKSDQNAQIRIQDLELQLQNLVEKYENQGVNLAQLQQQLKEESTKNEYKDQQIVQLKLELSNKDDLLEQSKDSILTLQKTINELNDQRTKQEDICKHKISELEKQLQEAEKHQNHDVNQTQLQQLVKEVQNQQNEIDQQQIQKLNQELTNKNVLLEDQANQITTLSNNIQELKNQRIQSDEDFKLQIQELENQLQEQIQKQISQDRMYQQLKQDQDEIVKQNLELQSTKTKFEEQNELLNTLQQKIEMLNYQQSKSDENYKHSIQQLEDQLAQEANKYQNLNAQMNEIDLQAQKLNQELKNKNNILEDQNKQISTLQTTIDELKEQKLNENQNSQNKITDLEKQLTNQLQKHNEQKANDAQLQQQLKESLDKQHELDSQVQKLNDELANKNSLLQESTQQINTLSDHIDELNNEKTKSNEDSKLKINQLEDQLHTIKIQNQQLQDQIQNETTQNNQLKESLQQQSSQLSDLKNQFQIILNQNMSLQWEIAGQQDDDQSEVTNTTIDDTKKEVQQMELLNRELEEKLKQSELKCSTQEESYENILKRIQIELDQQKEQISMLQDMIHDLGEENRALKFTLKSQKQTNGAQSPIEEILIDQHNILQEEYQQKEKDIEHLHSQLDEKEDVIHNLEAHIQQSIDEIAALKQHIQDQGKLIKDKQSTIDQLLTNNQNETEANQVIQLELQQKIQKLEKQLQDTLENQLNQSPPPKQQVIELQSEQKEDLVVQFSPSDVIDDDQKERGEEKSAEVLKLEQQLIDNETVILNQSQELQSMLKQRDQFEADIHQLQDKIVQLTNRNNELEGQNADSALQLQRESYEQQKIKMMSDTTIPEVSQDEHIKSEGQDQQLLQNQSQIIRQLESQITKQLEIQTDQAQRIQQLETLIQEQKSEIEQLQAQPKRIQHLTFNLDDAKQSPMRKEDLRANVYTPVSISSVKSEQFPKTKEERQKLMKNVMRSAQLSASMMAAKGDYTTLQQVVQQHDSSSSRGNSSRDLSQSYPPPKQ